MRYQDIHRIMQGVRLVTKNMCENMSPTLKAKVDKGIYHSEELCKVFVEIKDEILHQYAQDRPYSSSSPSSDEASQPPQTGPPTPIDPLGFSKVKYEDIARESVTYRAPNKMNERRVPSSPFARVAGFSGLAARMVAGAAVENISAVFSGQSASKISDANAERLADALCRMRGAALKLGQMLSLQDEGYLPPALAQALDKVRQGADYMPKTQLYAQLEKQLGEKWREQFLDFDDIPLAAASIGQVHQARLVDGTDVAVKIQYPGVAESIESDLDNLRTLVLMVNIFPKGLYVEEVIRVARQELLLECICSIITNEMIFVGQYKLEAANQIHYRELVSRDPILQRHCNVPKVYEDLSTDRILTTGLIKGVPIDKALTLPQETRNALGRTVLYLTMRELFEWRFMQTDPNWGNFFYDDSEQTLHLLDFGAARTFSKRFTDGYLKIVWAAANRDEDMLHKASLQLRFLTGEEAPEMLAAHINAGMVVGEPFLTHEPFDFAASRLTTRIGKHGETFMKHRLTPPPTEVYSLHRKLAGAFLLCIRLKAVIPCRDILEDIYSTYNFDS